MKFTDGNFVLFSAKCARSGKRFELKLQLFGDVQEEGSSWRLESVGRAVLTLKKTTPAVWPHLLKSAAKPGNIHVWWALKEKYERENSHYSAQNKKPTPKPDGETAPAAEIPAAASSLAANTAADSAAEAKATPTPDPYSLALNALTRQQESELGAISAERRARVTKLEAAAKEAKQAIDIDAATRKGVLDAQLETDRKSVDGDMKAQREAATARHKTEQQALHSEHGQGKSEL